MFEIRQGDLPFIQTRRALVVLDLQNDLVTEGCALPVEKPADLVDKIVKLARDFRTTGKIIWVRSQFERNRPVNDGHPDSEHVVTDAQIRQGPMKHGHGSTTEHAPSRSLQQMYQKMMTLYPECEEELGSEEEDEGEPVKEDNESRRDGVRAVANDEPELPFGREAFLTLSQTNTPEFMLPMLSGINFAQPIISILDGAKDTIFTKSHYSAFKSGQLIQALRGQFVTELYICGAFTNISIFATAMDAARYGYSITLVGDCLGYRSKARHDEALRQLVEATGCQIKGSHEIIEESKQHAIVHDSDARRNRGGRDSRAISQMVQGIRLKERHEPAAGIDSSSKPDVSTLQKSPHRSPGSSVHGSTSMITGAILTSIKSPNVNRVKSHRLQSKAKSRQHHSNAVPGERGTVRLEADSSKASSNLSPLPTRLIPTPKARDLDGAPETRPTKSLSASLSMTEENGMSPGLEAQDSDSGEEATEQRMAEIRAQVAAVRAERRAKGDKSVQALGDQGPMPYSNTLEVDDTICEGDTRVIHDLLPDANEIFYRVKDEVRWQKMSHQGGEVPRLIAVQGEIGSDGSKPLYRHPSDESPTLVSFSPAIQELRSEVEKRLGHRVNHCLIQFYRDGTDYISEHSDKTLDIAPGTFIANVSLGAKRTMTFRTKRQPKRDKLDTEEGDLPRSICKASLPHNSMCKMGLATNRRWLHGIRPDKRQNRERSEDERAYEGGRISITFRLIATFISRNQTHIWGQGAKAKYQYDARPVINGETSEAQRMIEAFGKENHDSHFDWQENYGEGFDVLHITNKRKLFLSGDAVTDLTVKIFLAEYDVSWSVSKLSPSFSWQAGRSPTPEPSAQVWPIVFVDNDLARSTLEGEIAISFYLEVFYGRGATAQDFTQSFLARGFTRRYESQKLLDQWRNEPFESKPFRWTLAIWDEYASEDLYIAGPMPTGADYTFWPVLHEIVKEWGVEGIGLKHLASYYERMKSRPTVGKALATDAS
ncbi:MAG: hypothetical protein M1818_006458 [Claussenomyces sp. TS43310]|nr:MAG: hypothetical protein M1818_006458 [Claussenomyces sp. TS43310]